MADPVIRFRGSLYQQWAFLNALVDPKTKKVNEALEARLKKNAIPTLRKYGIVIEGKTAKLTHDLDPKAIENAKALLKRQVAAFPDPYGQPPRYELVFQLDNQRLFLRIGLPYAMPFVPVDDGED